MRAGRLVVAVAAYAGWSVICAGAEELGVPLAVAVPVSESENTTAAVPDEETGMGRSATPGQFPRSKPETGAVLEEEYLPLDLPVPEGEDQPEPAPSPDAEVETPAMEPAVLGLDESPSYFVHAEIVGVPNSKGMVSASLCTRKNFTKSGCRTERVIAREGQVSVTFSGVAPGHYAVQVHHDQNDNGKMDYTFFGLPKEPYGFSRDAKPVLAPPKFEAASFEVTDGDISLIINLQNT